MILVALAVIAATAVGVVFERRFAGAPHAAARTLRLMLYALVPFVSYVNVGRLHVTVGAGVGIALGWLMIIAVGLAAFAIGRYALGLGDRQLGALITVVVVVVVNTGYLGLPMAVALLHARALGTAVAYDQLISGPALPILGFGVGAAFGLRGEGRPA